MKEAQLNHDCWFVHFSDGKIATPKIDKNAHEVLFIANAKTSNTVGGTSGRMTKIISIFRNEWIGNRHRNREILCKHSK